MELFYEVKGVEFIVFDKQGDKRAKQKFMQQLEGRKFDILLMLQSAFRASLISRHIGANLKIGFDRRRAKDLQWLFSSKKIPSIENQHVMDGLFGFVEILGINKRELDHGIPVLPENRAFADNIIGQTPTVLLSPNSSQPHKDWHIDGYCEVCEVLVKRGFQVVITGAARSDEDSYDRHISSSCNSPLIVDLTGKTNLKQLYALICAADLVIGPDSGPLHMANAAGTTCVGLYSGSNPARTGPYNFQDLVVNKYPEAVKKYLKKEVSQVKWGRRINRPDVMELITVDDVLAKIRIALEWS